MSNLDIDINSLLELYDAEIKNLIRQKFLLELEKKNLTNTIDMYLHMVQEKDVEIERIKKEFKKDE